MTKYFFFIITCTKLCFRTFKGKNDRADLLIFVIPALLMFFGQLTVIAALSAWLVIVMTSSFTFTFVGFSATHHFPDNFHDGDNVK